MSQANEAIILLRNERRVVQLINKQKEYLIWDRAQLRTQPTLLLVKKAYLNSGNIVVGNYITIVTGFNADSCLITSQVSELLDLWKPDRVVLIYRQIPAIYDWICITANEEC